MKYIAFVCIALLWSCSTPELPIPETPTTKDIFSTTQSLVANGQSIIFTLPSAGVYTLVLIDKESGQVISRERFTGQVGQNEKKIFTKSIQSRYLYLLLEDISRKELGKTTITIN